MNCGISKIYGFLWSLKKKKKEDNRWEHKKHVAPVQVNDMTLNTDPW